MSTESWSVPVTLAEIPETGRHVSLVADEHARNVLARLAGVPGVSRLAADFDLSRHGRGGVHVAGRVSATVRQNCVVTLEPMDSDISEDVDLVFMPEQTRGSRDENSEEPPEALRNDTVDLGAIAAEFLMLGINPYPRKPGSVFEAPAVKEGQGPHPFAALASLKNAGRDKKNS